jgi:hypothetical protein
MKKQLLTLITLTFATTLTAQIPNYVPSNGLLGWWPFNGNANDESGNGNNGTVNGATLTADRFGVADKAYVFDGVDDFIKVNQLYDLEQRTVNLWFLGLELFQSGNSAYQILNVDTQILQYGLTSLQIENNTLHLFGGGEQFPFTIPIDSNSWYMVTTTRDLSSVKYYLNGIFIGASVSGTVTSTSNDNPNLLIGVDRAETVQFFNGSIDDIGIWNRALSACEIQDLYNAQLGSSTTSSTQTQTALDGYTWPVNGQTYTQSGWYYDTLTNAAGCDSVITLDLTLSFTGIEQIQYNASKKLAKITDLNGKETPFRKNTVLLFVYEDGTVERVYVAE